jgi:hypothetical protein
MKNAMTSRITAAKIPSLGEKWITTLTIKAPAVLAASISPIYVLAQS